MKEYGLQEACVEQQMEWGRVWFLVISFEAMVSRRTAEYAQARNWAQAQYLVAGKIGDDISLSNRVFSAHICGEGFLRRMCCDFRWTHSRELVCIFSRPGAGVES